MKREQEFMREWKGLFELLFQEEALNEAEKVYSDTMMIPGKEEAGLREVLHRAPEKLLDIIYENTKGQKPGADMDRGQKEEVLYREIPILCQENVFYLEPQEFILLLQIADRREIKTMAVAEALLAFVPFGWVFCFLEDGSVSLDVTDEVRDVLMRIKTEEQLERKSFLDLVRCLVCTCLDCCGVFTAEWLREVFQSLEEDENERAAGTERFDAEAEGLLSFLERNGVLRRDKNYITDSYFQEPREYRRLLRTRSEELYMPTEADLLRRYGGSEKAVGSPEYENMLRLLTRELKDRELASALLQETEKFVTREDWEIPQIFDYLRENAVCCGIRLSAGRLTQALAEWTYTIRRWSEGGYSRKERMKPNLDLKYVPSVSVKKETEKRIYPNDPCPCGSGKKYKRCCGK